MVNLPKEAVTLLTLLSPADYRGKLERIKEDLNKCKPANTTCAMRESLLQEADKLLSELASIRNPPLKAKAGEPAKKLKQEISDFITKAKEFIKKCCTGGGSGGKKNAAGYVDGMFDQEIGMSKPKNPAPDQPKPKNGIE
jgi:hypothetical protein